MKNFHGKSYISALTLQKTITKYESLKSSDPGHNYVFSTVHQMIWWPLDLEHKWLQYKGHIANPKGKQMKNRD